MLQAAIAPAPARTPEVSYLELGSRRLRVLRWQSEDADRHCPPLLFFSGIGGNAELMAPFMAALAETRDVVTFDMPGIGDSDPAGGPYLPSTMAEAADHVLAMHAYETVDVMGVSWGGMMAEQFAIQYPKRVRRLVLAATAAGLLMIPGKAGALALMLNPRKYTDPGFMHRYFGSLFGGGREGWERYCRGIRPPSRAGYVYQLLALLSWTGFALLHRIEAKTLILAGEEDRLVRSVNAHLLKLILPNATVRFVEGAGHMLLLTHLGESAAAVEDFLDLD